MTECVSFKLSKNSIIILRGVKGQKVWEHDFEITSDPKGHQRGPTFWSYFEGPDPKAPAWRPRQFSRQKGRKNGNRNLILSITGVKSMEQKAHFVKFLGGFGHKTHIFRDI